MPVYEYRCSKGHNFEKTQGFDAPSTTKCTVCGARSRRQLSMPAVIFKGSGFYSTDSRGSAPAAGRSSSSDGDSTPASSDNGHSHGADGHSHSPKADDAKSETSVD